MFRKRNMFLISFIILLSLTGCASIGNKRDLQLQALKNQVSVLEAQLESKEKEVTSLKEEINNQRQKKVILAEVVSSKKIVPEIKSRPKIRQIQIALKNAGYNPGGIDGKMGPQTKDAIRAFQRAHNLVADGKVGKQTWDLLKGYLYKRSK